MPVHSERRGRVGIITLDRPSARNAFDGELTDGFVAAVDAFEEDSTIRAVVVTGTGNFSSGGDLSVIAVSGVGPISTPEGGFAGFVYRTRTKPYIAAVEGAAVGGGCELALACDIVVAGRSATFSLPEVKRGLVAGAGGLVRLGASIGTGRAMLMLLTGAAVTAEKAYDFGLAAEVVDTGSALASAVAVAEQIAANSPSAVRASLDLVRRASGVEDQSLVAAQEQARVDAWESVDRREGIQAFLEKREPQWDDVTQNAEETLVR
ncbi:enoyl-CoA hydratase/isomerase family protein [Microbacterium sp. NPDC058062]|uniref:enoyl-CoA hydratase/isomerase family protein n=1 Tax=Microbacterium sp. NPDC058062 TaxID=3346320 RepID=UPI0036DEC6FE